MQYAYTPLLGCNFGGTIWLHQSRPEPKVSSKVHVRF